MTTRTLLELLACVSVALMSGACGTSNGSASASPAENQNVFQTRGRILVGDPPRPASNVEVRLVDLAPARFSPMGPTGTLEFAGTQAKTNSAGRFTIETKSSPAVRKALTRRSLGLTIIGHGKGAGLVHLKSEENPDYVLASTRVGQ